MQHIQNKLSVLTAATRLIAIPGINMLDYKNFPPTEITNITNRIQIIDINQTTKVITIPQSTKQTKRNIFGALKGQIIFNSDFDAPLPDEIINLYYGE